MAGRHSHVREHGGQGSRLTQAQVLDEQRNEELRKTLAESQTNEAMRRAREYLPAAVDRLRTLIANTKTPPQQIIKATELMAAIAYPKAHGGGASASAGGTKLLFQVNQFGGPGSGARTIAADAMPVKKLASQFDEALDG